MKNHEIETVLGLFILFALYVAGGAWASVGIPVVLVLMTLGLFAYIGAKGGQQ